jgi:hypothetical protein
MFWMKLSGADELKKKKNLQLFEEKKKKKNSKNKIYTFEKINFYKNYLKHCKISFNIFKQITLDIPRTMSHIECFKNGEFKKIEKKNKNFEFEKIEKIEKNEKIDNFGDENENFDDFDVVYSLEKF